MSVVHAHTLEPAFAVAMLERQSAYTPAQRAMAADHPHLMFVVAKRRALSSALRTAVYERDLGICRYCGVSLTRADFTVDHVRPVARGGDDVESNLVVACRSCNSAKGAK